MIPAAHGAACVGFGVLTFAFLHLSLDVTLFLVSVWLVLYAALTLGLALGLWPMRRTRLTLLGCTVVNLSISVLALTMRETTIMTLLYAGAGYAVAFGLLQIVGGLWLRRVALPYFAPLIQSTWAVHAAVPVVLRG